MCEADALPDDLQRALDDGRELISIAGELAVIASPASLSSIKRSRSPTYVAELRGKIRDTLVSAQERILPLLDEIKRVGCEIFTFAGMKDRSHAALALRSALMVALRKPIDHETWERLMLGYIDFAVMFLSEPIPGPLPVYKAEWDELSHKLEGEIRSVAAMRIARTGGQSGDGAATEESAEAAGDVPAGKQAITTGDPNEESSKKHEPTEGDATATGDDGAATGTGAGEQSNGFLGGGALADKLGIAPSRRNAFFKQLERKRRSFPKEDWHEGRKQSSSAPTFFYMLESSTLRALAARYKAPESS